MESKQLEKLENMIGNAIREKTLTKIVLSRSTDAAVKRGEVKRIASKGGETVQLAVYTTDNKVRHNNFPTGEAAGALCEIFSSQYRQLNLMTTGGNAEAKLSKSGTLTVIGNIASGEETEADSHNKDKNYILKENVPCAFLEKLGISDKNGRVYDKKQAKFRQINRFLEYVSDIMPLLPAEGTLRVLDLCCGKSYLSFAVYYYLTEVLGREVEMLGADLKADVIEYCAGTAASLGYTGLNFVCTDISKLELSGHPHLVLSLHACDIATDIVLKTAVSQKAEVILSTPCCQHEMFHSYDPDRSGWKALGGLAKQSMIRQKLSEAFTDALRCLYLESEGYQVVAAELTDPENTPKNLLIRAVRHKIPSEKQAALKAEYISLRDSFYGESGGIRS